jgi:integrase
VGPNVVRVVLTSPHDHITPRQRERGEIETLTSGSLRVKVYAGIDPLSGKRHYLTETIPTGPKAFDAAKKARTRLINQVDEQRNPRTRATVDLDRSRSCRHSVVDCR